MDSLSKGKKMTKIKNNLVLALSGIMVGFILCCNNASAAEISISSEKIPQEKVEIAKEKWEEYSNNFIMDTSSKLSDYYLGQGFTVNNLETANFPIVKRDSKDISYILQISKDNQLLLSKNYGTKLNDLSKRKTGSDSNPITLFGDKQTIFYSDQQGDSDVLIGHDPEPESTSIDSVNQGNQLTVNLTEVLENPNLSKNSLMAAFDHVVLPWKAYEIQTDKRWCNWYTITGVMNNLANRKVVTAEQLIRGSYPKATTAEINDVKWIIKQNLITSLNYANSKYKMSIAYEAGKPNFTSVKNEIKTRKSAFVVNCEDKKGGYGHSLVQMGYTASSNSANAPYYYYWNPWWEDTFVVSSSAPYMELGVAQYMPDGSIINFSKPTY